MSVAALMSTTSGAPVVGMATLSGFVPKSASEEPWGATTAGKLLTMNATQPCSARRST